MLLARAVKLYEDGQWDDAEQIFRQILETAPEQPDVLNLLGLVAQAKGVHQEAVTLFYKAIKNKPDCAPFYYNLAFSLRQWGKPYEAIESYRKVLALEPGVKEAYNEMGLIYKELGDLAKAREHFQKAIDLDRSFALARLNLIMTYENDMLKVQKDIESLLKEFPDFDWGWYALSQASYRLKDYGKAWSAAANAKELNPTSDEVRVILGLLSLEEQNSQNARIYFEKALLLNPYNVTAMLNLANILAAGGEFEEAEVKYKRVIELDRLNFEAHNNYAEMLYRQKRYAEALEEYRAAVIIDPKSAAVSNNLGIILKDTGDYEQALGLFFNALALDAKLEEASVNLAETLLLYYRQGHKDEALKIAENWQKQMSGNIFAQHSLAALKGENSDNIEVNRAYSERLFDHFADNYELVMQNLGYSVPLAMGRIAGYVKGTIVDLGCGSGLAGEALKNAENYLIGVDLSQKMLDLAEKKGVYERLVKEDALTYLQNNGGFDLIVAADVLGYIGDLAPVFAAAKGARFIFSVETNAEIETFKLSAAGRYQYNPLYIEKLLQENGYRNIIKEKLDLRKENDGETPGLIFMVQ